MKVKCSSPSCQHRRIHWTQPFKERGKPVEFEVPEGTPGPYFCSNECWSYYQAEKRKKEEDSKT